MYATWVAISLQEATHGNGPESTGLGFSSVAIESLPGGECFHVSRLASDEKVGEKIGSEGAVFSCAKAAFCFRTLMPSYGDLGNEVQRAPRRGKGEGKQVEVPGNESGRG